MTWKTASHSYLLWLFIEKPNFCCRLFKRSFSLSPFTMASDSIRSYTALYSFTWFELNSLFVKYWCINFTLLKQIPINNCGVMWFVLSSRRCERCLFCFPEISSYSKNETHLESGTTGGSHPPTFCINHIFHISWYL